MDEWEIVRDLVKLIANSMTEIGNCKKMGCENFEQTLCSLWSWEEKPKFHFQMNEPIRQGVKWYINPNPMFCALCHKWKSSTTR